MKMEGEKKKQELRQSVLLLLIRERYFQVSGTCFSLFNYILVLEITRTKSLIVYP